MVWLTKTRVKYVLAAVGAGYVVLFAGYLVFAAMNRPAPSGPSDLEAHPERQDEILAQRRAEEMKQRLNLSDEQTRQVAEIMNKQHGQDFGPPLDSDIPGESGFPGGGGSRERRQALEQEIAKVLTPEQRTQAEQMRAQFRGPGGPWGQISPERINSLKEKMTPDQRARFEKKLQKMQQGRGQGGRPGGGGGNGGGPGSGKRGGRQQNP